VTQDAYAPPLIASLDNFRDAGGCETLDGHRVRAGRLYRSDTLVKLGPADADAFARLGIRTVIDLRRPNEVAEDGRIADAVDRRYINISPRHPLWDDYEYDERAGPARFLADRYHDLSREGMRELGTVITTLAEASAEPTVVHCFAGKDRTGVVIGLTLGAVGVGVDAIADDYALSNDWSVRITFDDLRAHWVPAPREAMVMFLGELIDAYGSVHGYLRAAGVEDGAIGTLRANLVA
jgi:protein tyrosine/serine phosphatase